MGNAAIARRDLATAASFAQVGLREGAGPLGGLSRVSARAGEVQLAATKILQVAGIPAYHTSIILGAKEYYFDSGGILSAPALWSHLAGYEEGECHPQATQVIHVGTSPLAGSALTNGLAHFFAEGSYDILLKNCNAFTDAAIYFLTRTRLDGQFNRLERIVANTRPFSMHLFSAVVRAFSPESEDGDVAPVYTPNPRAESFSVEDVVATCDALDASTAPRRPRSVVANLFSCPAGYQTSCSCLAPGVPLTYRAHVAGWGHPDEVSETVVVLESLPTLGDEPPSRPGGASSLGVHAGTPERAPAGLAWRGSPAPRAPSPLEDEEEAQLGRSSCRRSESPEPQPAPRHWHGMASRSGHRRIVLL